MTKDCGCIISLNPAKIVKSCSYHDNKKEEIDEEILRLFEKFTNKQEELEEEYEKIHKGLNNEY